MIESPDSHVCGPFLIVRLSLLQQSAESSVFIIGQGCESLPFLTPAISASLSSTSCCCVSKTLVPVSYKRVVRSRIGVCAESHFYADDFLKFVD